MSDTNVDIADIRYEHHLKHRGSANQRIFWIVWACISMLVLFRFGWTLFVAWSRRVPQVYQRSPSKRIRALAHIKAIGGLPFPLLLRRALTELSVGRVGALAAYIFVVTTLLLSVDAPTSTPHFVDDVAFRAAWLTTTQIPLVFFVSTKHGPINMLAHISYERLLYLHKWTGRMIFLTATTHVAIMKSSISLADVILSRDSGAMVVRYGIGSYILLVWIALSSVLPIRRWSYRAFYINHSISTLGFLMVVLQHVPKHAMAPIYMAFGFVALDKILTLALFARINISVRPLRSRLAKFRRGPGRATLIAGYPVEMVEPHNLCVSTSIKESTTTVRICNVPLKWRPGQHIRLYLPALGAYEMHPFTPANCSSIAVPPPLPPRRSEDIERRASASSMTSSRASTDILLMIRAHSGLTQRLKEAHAKWLQLPCPNATEASVSTSLTAYIDGPYGNPPRWEHYDNLIFVATSTGVSFAMSAVDYLEQMCLSDASKLRTQVIRFIWIVRHVDPHFEETVAELLRRYGMILKDSGVRFETELYVTCGDAEFKPSLKDIDQFAHLRPRMPRYGSGDRMLTIRNPDEIYDEWEEEERQWAEMEAMEELQMKQVDPFEDENEIRSDYSGENGIVGEYEGEGYANSETSTLLNGANGHSNSRHSSTFSNIRLTVDENSALTQSRPLSSPIRSPLLSRQPRSKEKICDCTLIQYQREKLHKPKKFLFDSCTYGRRPEIACIISSALTSDQYSRSMVAVCANAAVSRQARTAVSRVKAAFARGERATDAEIFTEGFR